MAHKITRKDLKHDKLVDIVSTSSSSFDKYRKVYISLGAIFIILLISLVAIYYQKSSKGKQAALLLSHSRSLQSLRQVYQKYGETDSAPLALMLVAASSYHSNQIDEAEKAYRLFLERYPTHQLAPFAQMGTAYCQESRRNWEEAITSYRKVEEKYSRSSLGAEAIMNIGRCQTQLNRNQEAINSYEEVISLYPRSLYVPIAREQLVQLKSKERDHG